MPYSAVTQPLPLLSRQGGTPAEIDAVQIRTVSPIEISTEPSAVRTKPGSIEIGRSWSSARPSGRAASAAPEGALVSVGVEMSGCYPCGRAQPRRNFPFRRLPPRGKCGPEPCF